MRKESYEISGRNKALKAFRVFNRMTQQALSEKLDLSKSFISEMESGKKPVTSQLIDRYADYFGVPSWEITYLAEAYDNKILANTFTSTLLKLLDWVMSDDSHDTVKLTAKKPPKRRASDKSPQRRAGDLAGI